MELLLVENDHWSSRHQFILSIACHALHLDARMLGLRRAHKNKRREEKFRPPSKTIQMKKGTKSNLHVPEVPLDGFRTRYGFVDSARPQTWNWMRHKRMIVALTVHFSVWWRVWCLAVMEKIRFVSFTSWPHPELPTQDALMKGQIHLQMQCWLLVNMVGPLKVDDDE